MKNLFSIGELSKQQNISRQTLIFYDKIGLFPPAYVDPENGYRYYSSSQLDYLDTICIMKKIGFSLNEIKTYMENYTIDHSIVTLRKQHRCRQLEHAVAIRNSSDIVALENVKNQYILIQEVPSPHTLESVSIATKECFVRSFREQLPIFFQSGAIVPYEHILNGRYTEAAFAFLPIEKIDHVPGVVKLPAGKSVFTYHTGTYISIGKAYERILEYCRNKHLHIISDSYEFAINDYLSTGDEDEYITKIMFYVE